MRAWNIGSSLCRWIGSVPVRSGSRCATSALPARRVRRVFHDAGLRGRDRVRFQTRHLRFCASSSSSRAPERPRPPRPPAARMPCPPARRSPRGPWPRVHTGVCKSPVHDRVHGRHRLRLKGHAGGAGEDPHDDDSGVDHGSCRSASTTGCSAPRRPQPPARAAAVATTMKKTSTREIPEWAHAAQMWIPPAPRDAATRAFLTKPSGRVAFLLTIRDGALLQNPHAVPFPLDRSHSTGLTQQVDPARGRGQPMTVKLSSPRRSRCSQRSGSGQSSPRYGAVRQAAVRRGRELDRDLSSVPLLRSLGEHRHELGVVVVVDVPARSCGRE